MNKILECYHPKISYLISKYKVYIKNVYEKIKINLVNNSNSLNTEKFSVINDILKYIKNYNDQYNSCINVNIIMQSSDSEKEIIYKVCNYVLDLFFDFEEEEDDEKNQINESRENGFDEIENDSMSLNFEEFYPREQTENERKKRPYNKVIDMENELNIFWEDIIYSKKHKKSKKEK